MINFNLYLSFSLLRPRFGFRTHTRNSGTVSSNIFKRYVQNYFFWLEVSNHTCQSRRVSDFPQWLFQIRVSEVGCVRVRLRPVLKSKNESRRKDRAYGGISGGIILSKSGPVRVHKGTPLYKLMIVVLNNNLFLLN